MPSARCAGSVRPPNTDIAGQSAAAPTCQGRLRNFLECVEPDGSPVAGASRLNIGGGTEAGDRVDDMVGEGLHIPVATGRGPVEVAGDRSSRRHGAHTTNACSALVNSSTGSPAHEMLNAELT